MELKSNFLKICSERGFINQTTDISELDNLLHNNEKKNIKTVGYIGFDCTAESLHVGSLIQIMILRHLQQCGHKPIILMGGGTSKVGDPSGKDKSRQLIDETTIKQNMTGIQTVFGKFLNIEREFNPNSSDAFFVNNDEWLDQLNYIDFLREYGRHFSINRMLTMESVKLRLEREQTLSFLEFNYMILQAYDFVELYKRYGCRLQIGGSDQWGNIVNGVELNRRLNAAVDNQNRTDHHEELFGLTTPLLTTSTGAKMGKTADGAIWLNENMLPAYDYWQFWRNTEDADVGRFLRLFTELDLEEIARLETLEGAEINKAKKILATEATALLHGREKAENALKAAEETFEKGRSSQDLPTIDLADEENIKERDSIAVFKLFQLSGLTKSGGEARRLIKGGGARINDEQIKDENAEINLAEYRRSGNGTIKLSAGKKRHIMVKI